MRPTTPRSTPRQPPAPAARTGRPQAGGLRLFVVLGSVSVVAPASMDIYLPALPTVASDMGVSASEAQLTLTTFLVGMGLGQLLLGPLSDVHGRRRPLVVGLAAFALASLVCALAPGLHALAAVRLVQGATAASGIVIARAVVRDLYAGAAAARYLSRLILIIGLGPVLAPVVGGQVLGLTSWRGLFVVVALLGLVLAVTTFFLLPETLPLERRRASGAVATLRTYGTLLVDRSFVGYALTIGFGASALFAFLSGSSFVLQDVSGASPQLYGVLFATGALVMVAGAQLNAHLVVRVGPRRLVGVGLTATSTAGVLFVLAIPTRGAGLVSVMPAVVLLLLSWSFVQANTVALALASHAWAAGSAAGVLGVTQFAFGATIAPLVGLGGRETVAPMAVAILGCGLAALVTYRRLVPPTTLRDA